MTSLAGTYVEFPLHPASDQYLKDFIEKTLLFPRPKNLHSTTVYSHNPIDYSPGVYQPSDMVALPNDYHFLLFHRLGDPGRGLCLCLGVNAAALHQCHRFAKWLGATWDYPDFSPHITLAYNLGVEDVVGRKLYLPRFQITFLPEVVKELDPDGKVSK